MGRTSIPNGDTDLLAYGRHFVDLLAQEGETYGATPAAVARLQDLQGLYADAFSRATAPATRTKVAILAKDAARRALVAELRRSILLARGQEGMTDAALAALGVLARRPGGTVPPPAEAPLIEVVSVFGRHIKLRLRPTSSATRRGRPDGVAGASVFAHVGGAPPEGTDGWTFVMNASRMTVALPWVGTAAADTLWVTAFYFNGRKQRGPSARPVRIDLAAATPLPHPHPHPLPARVAA